MPSANLWLCINSFLEALEIKKPSGDRVTVEDPAFQCVDSLENVSKESERCNPMRHTRNAES